MVLETDQLKAYRIGRQGEYSEAEFFFKARADLTTISIGLGFKYTSCDSNELAQILMLRFCDKYLSQLSSKDLILSINLAIDIIIDVIKNHQNEKLFWDTMVSGTRVLKLLYLKKIVCTNKNNYNIDEIKLLKLNEIIELHCDKMSTIIFPSNNHGLQGLHSLVALAHHNYGKVSKEHAIDNLLSIFSTMFNKEGFYLENSAEYHFYAVQMIKDFNSAGWYNNTNLMSFKRDAEQFYPHLFAAHNKVFAFGDTDRELIKNQVDREEIEYTPRPENEVVIKTDTGLAISRQNIHGKVSSLLMTNAFHSKMHNHHDYLSFEWFYDDEWIIIDAGKYTYDNIPEKEWFLSELAHNTINLREIGHNYIRSRKIVNGQQVVNGNILSSTILDDKFTIKRDIYHNANSVSIYDELFINTPNKKNLISSLNISPIFKSCSVVNDNEITFTSDKLILTLHSDSKIEVFNGSKEPFSGWHAPKYKNLQQNYQVKMLIPLNKNICKPSYTITLNTLDELNRK